MKKAILSPILILFASLTITSCNNKPDVNGFVTNFYSSLELNEDGTNKSGKNKHYNSDETRRYVESRGYDYDESLEQFNGKLLFDDSLFKSYLNNAAVVSQDRIQNLTGFNHDKFTIKLIKVDSIKFKYNSFNIGKFAIENKFNCIKVIAYTEVQYKISELGSFVNKEILEISTEGDSLKLNSWRDINIVKYAMEPSNKNINDNANRLFENQAAVDLSENPEEIQTYLYENIGSLLIEDSINSIKTRREKYEIENRRFWRSVGYDLGPEKYQ
jgi:hypothetical protein